MSESEVRLRLLTAGYIPTPCVGKRGTVKDWPTTLSVTPELIEYWGRSHPNATNTGVLTRYNPGLDVDLTDPAAAEAIEDLAVQRFERVDTLIPVRIGKPPKRLLLFRLAGAPFKKLARVFGPPEGDEEAGERLEFLADGQLVVVAGIHPATGRAYEWPHGGPGDIKLADLTPITAGEAEQFMEDATRLLVERFGYQLRSKSKPKETGNGAEGGEHDPTDWSFNPLTLIDHDKLAGLAMKLVRAGTAPGATRNFLRQNVEALTGVDPDRRQRRLDEIPGMVSSAEAKAGQERAEGGDGGQGDDEAEPPLPYVDLALPLKGREWLVHERIPMFNVTLVSGEGAVGKSILLMQLAGSTVLGKGWIGTIPAQGPVLYISAEEDDDEARRRMEDVAADLGSTRPEMIASGLRVLSFAGRDAILGEPDKKGIIRPTRLFVRIHAEAQKLRPKLIIVDTVADAFGGDEIKRAQARQFVSLLRGLAISAGAAVVLAAHPSLAGVATDTGLSGSTGWHNSVRARAYFKPAPGEDKALRALEWRKNQYGPPDASPIVLRWRNGVYVVEPGDGTFEELAAQAEMDQLFLTLLRRFEEQGRAVSDKPSATYAPAVFSSEPEAKAAKATKAKLAVAMARLFAAKKIKVRTFGPPSRERTRISENQPLPTPSNAQIIPFSAFQRPSNAVATPPSDPSNALPTASTEASHTPPIPPVPLEGANGAVLEGGPAPANGAHPPAKPPPQAPYEVLGLAPGERCSLCGGGGGVLRIRRGGEVNAWHEACAAKYVAAMAAPAPADEEGSPRC